MITIRPEQMQQMSATVRSRFAAKLTHQLQAEYPELFQALPNGLAERMVSNKIDYAEDRYEIHYQNALTTFLHYCCAIAPGFDAQPEIQEVLDDLSLYPDDIPDLLPEVVIDEAWQEAAENARRSDWFGPNPKQLKDHVAVRTCWAMAAIAAKQSRIQSAPDEEALSKFIDHVIEIASSHRIVDPAGVTAFAVCQSVLGPDFYRRPTKPWIAPIFSDPAILPSLRGMTLAGCVELEWGIEI
ncbi:MAG: hypothetical protein ACU836_02860 [Gammaproteobacteria bacterium]